MKNFAVIATIGAAPLLAAPLWTTAAVRPLDAQTATGELRFHIGDSQGLGLPSTVTLFSEASQVNKTLQSDSSGNLDVRRVPFGAYVVTFRHKGFAPLVKAIEVRSTFPLQYSVKLHPGRNGHPERTEIPSGRFCPLGWEA